MATKVTVRNFDQGGFSEVDTDNLKFRVSVYGLLIENNQLLIHLHPKSSKYNIPGGAIERGEKIEDALIREYQEETGLLVKPTKLKTIKESLVTFDNKEFFHTILIFYEVERVGGVIGEIDSNEGDSIGARFVDINENLENNLEDVFKNILNT